jgi:hypothetical protein
LFLCSKKSFNKKQKKTDPPDMDFAGDLAGDFAGYLAGDVVAENLY